MAFNPKEHMMNLKGKEYLEVKWRLVWFREDHPTWQIDTILLSSDDKSALFACKIYDETGRQISSGHGSESVRDFADYIEKAETKSIGRALAMLGYGTQFAPELEEGERIVDAPVDRKAAPKAPAKPQEEPKQNPPKPKELDYVLPEGIFKGLTIAQVYKNKKVPDLISDANTRKDDYVINAIRTVNAYIAACK